MAYCSGWHSSFEHIALPWMFGHAGLDPASMQSGAWSTRGGSAGAQGEAGGRDGSFSAHARDHGLASFEAADAQDRLVRSAPANTRMELRPTHPNLRPGHSSGALGLAQALRRAGSRDGLGAGSIRVFVACDQARAGRLARRIASVVAHVASVSRRTARPGFRPGPPIPFLPRVAQREMGLLKGNLRTVLGQARTDKPGVNKRYGRAL
jgi:hypothetical protein